MTSKVAHEINNPLGGIRNRIYHFKRGIQSIEKQQQYLDLMEDGIKRIQKAVTNLLEYARNPYLDRSKADFRVLIEKALNLLDYQIRKNQIRIEQDFLETIPPLKVDRNQMNQVLVNVFSNAIQAMQDGGMLKVTIQTTDGRLILTISDTGGEIREEDLPEEVCGHPIMIHEVCGKIRGSKSLANATKLFEKEYIQSVLEKTRGKKGQAAEILGISRRTLWEKIKELEIEI